MVVLARRANGIFILAPIIFIALLFVVCYSLAYLRGEIEISDIPVVMYFIMCMLPRFTGSRRWSPRRMMFATLFEAMFCFFLVFESFASRLFVPKVIMECDSDGVYIYHGRKQVTVLKYEYLWSHYTEEDLDGGYLWVKRGMIPMPEIVQGFITTGSMRIETPDGFINLKGIYHVREVERELKTRMRKHRLEYEQLLDKSVREAAEDRERAKLDT